MLKEWGPKTERRNYPIGKALIPHCRTGRGSRWCPGFSRQAYIRIMDCILAEVTLRLKAVHQRILVPVRPPQEAPTQPTARLHP